MVEVRTTGPVRYRARARTLFLRKEVPSVLPRAILEAGGRVTGNTADRYDATFRDGTRATFEHASCVTGGRAVTSKLGYASTYFRARAVRRELADRRGAVLRQLMQAVGLVTATTPTGDFAGDVARALAMIATRTEAFVYDSISLQTSSGQVLLTRKGYVVDHLPAAWKMAPPASAWRAKPRLKAAPDARTRLLLCWGDDLDALRRLQDERSVVDGRTPWARVRVHTETNDQGKLAGEIMALRVRIEKWPVGARRERRSKVLFALARVKGVVHVQPEAGWTADAELWLRDRARSLHTWVVGGDSIYDEDYRLLLSDRGAFDEQAGAASRVLVFSSTGTELPLPSLPPGLEARPLKLPDRSLEITRGLDHLRGLRLRRGARLRQHALHPWLEASSALLIEGVSGRPLDLSQIATVLHLARQHRAVVFDGWGVYDGDGRGLLLMNGMCDPAARAPE